VSYSIDIDPGAQDAIAALPHDALLAGMVGPTRR